MPALIIWTDADPYFPVSVAHDLLGALPLARLEVIEVIHDAGHLPQEQQPSQFSRIVLDWLVPSTAPPDSLR